MLGLPNGFGAPKFRRLYMEIPKFTFNSDFQLALIKLLFQKFDFLVFGADVLQPEYFESKIHIRLFQIIVDYYRERSAKITDVILWNEIEKDYKAGRLKDDAVLQLKDIFDDINTPVSGEDYIREEVVRWCKRQATRKAMLECAGMTDSEDESVWDEIYGKIGEAVRVGDNANKQGTHYFRDFQARIEARNTGDDRLTIPTGITSIDSLMKGGPKAGQIAFWMAASGVGKSLALAHVGKRAVVGGFKVLHYTLELSEQETSDRYDSCWARVPFQDLVTNTSKITNELGTLHAKYGDSLIIKEYPTKGATVNTLESHMINLINTGWIPNMIIVDYLDLLRPTTNYNDLYADLGAITGELRGLGAKYNCVVWTATQVNRAGYSMEVVDMEQAGDSLQKMMIADIVIAICMNKEERANNRARLFLAKNRNGPAKVEKPIVTAYERMCFYDPVATQDAANTPSEKPVNVVTKKPVKTPPVQHLQAPSMPKPIKPPPSRRKPLNTVKFPVDDGDP